MYEKVPGLMMTRSFGDRIGHTIGMISMPDTVDTMIADADVGVVLGSDGLWDRLSPSDISKLLKTTMYQTDAERSCQLLVDAAEQCRGTKSLHLAGQSGAYMDDITCVFATFNRRLIRTTAGK